MPGRKKQLALVAVLAIVLTGAAVADRLFAPEQARLFRSSSPFNQPIPKDAAIDRKSRRYIDALAAAVREKGFTLSSRRWTIPVFYATEETPTTTVRLLAPWAPAESLSGIRIPANAIPDPAGDRHLAVIDTGRGCQYELFAAQRRGGAWSAQWANAIPLDSSGIYRGGVSSRASGFAVTAGLVFPDELRSGSIRHALVFTSPLTRAGGPVLPATSSDGRSTSPSALPEGARLQLDPALDLSTLELAPWQRTIAVALQRYGMFLADSGGAVALQAVNLLSYPANPYAELLPSGASARLPPALVEHLRVLRLPRQYRPDPSLDTGGCGAFARPTR